MWLKILSDVFNPGPRCDHHLPSQTSRLYKCPCLVWPCRVSARKIKLRGLCRECVYKTYDRSGGERWRPILQMGLHSPGVQSDCWCWDPVPVWKAVTETAFLAWGVAAPLPRCTPYTSGWQCYSFECFGGWGWGGDGRVRFAWLVGWPHA